MTEDKKQNEEITQAGAVELEENQLDEAAGGIIAVVEPDFKFAPGANKYDPVSWKLSPDLPSGHKIG